MNKEELNEIDNYLTNNISIGQEYFDSKLLAHPSNDYLLGMNIYMNYKDGDRLKLEELLSKEITSTPQLTNSSYIEFAKGIIEFNKENKKDALSHYLRSMEIDKLSNNSNKWLRFELYSYYKETELSTALKYLNEALSIDTNFTSAQYELAFIHRDNGDLNSAIEILDDVILRLDDDYAIYTKAFFLEELEEYSKAELLYTELISKSNYLEAYIGLGMIAQYRHGDLFKAENCFKEVLKIDNTNDEAYGRLFRLYIELEKSEEAHNYIAKAFELNGNEDNLIDLIYAKTLLTKYGESENLIKQYYSTFDPGYEIDLWDILISSLKGDKEGAQLKINQYYKNYTSAEIDFLKSELETWNINIGK